LDRIEPAVKALMVHVQENVPGFDATDVTSPEMAEGGDH
jgi:hypothetical protein